MSNIRTGAIVGAVAFSGSLYTSTSFSQDSESLVVEEVVVTAQRRAQSLQDVPIAVSAVNADTMKQVGLSGLEDLSNIVSGVSIGNAQSGQSQSSVRGVTSAPFGIGVEESVPFYLDGIYLGAGYDTLGELVDVAQTEVLKGPQGTLFGRNASAGAINVRTVRPDEELAGTVSVDVGNYDLRSVKLSGNIPLIENKLYTRAGYLQKDRDGWQTNVVTGDKDGYEIDRWSGYAKVLWLVSDTIEIEFSGDWAKRKDHPGYVSAAGVNTLFSPVYETQALPETFTTNGQSDYASASEAFTFAGIPVAPAERVDLERTREVRGISAALSWNIDDTLDFQALSSYRDSDRESANDGDGSNLGFVTNYSESSTEEFNQEFRLNYSSDMFDSFVGFNYFHQEREIDFLVNASGLVTFQRTQDIGAPITPDTFAQSVTELSSGQNTTDSYSAYGDVIWHINDRFNFTVGMRYTYDEKEFEQYETGNNTLNGGGILFPTIAQLEDPSDVKVDDTWDNLSGRVVLDYALGEDTLVYGSVAQGYKSGGFNSTRTVGAVDGELIMPTVAAEPFEEETNINVELGFKSTFMDGRLRLNSSIYIYEYDDLQFLLAAPTAPVALTTNAPRVDGHGLDAEVYFVATQNLHLFANFAYLSAEYGEDVVDPDNNVRFEEGQDTPFSPEVSGSIGFDYQRSLDGLGDMRLFAVYSYTDDQLQTGQDRASSLDPSLAEADSYSVVNARLSWISPNEQWEVALWGNNLTDEFYTTFKGQAAASTAGVITDYPAQPRTYGVNVEYSF